MNNNIESFEITPVQQIGNIQWDFEKIKEQLSEVLKPYEGLVYTEDTIKDAKKDRANLNKLKKEIQTKQKESKEACLNPYRAIENEIKDLIEMVELRSCEINLCVSNFEGKAKEKKRIEIKNYYDSKSIPLGKLAESMYEKIYNPKWENATCTIKKYQEEITIKIADTLVDLKKIKEINSPFEKEVMETYCNTVDFESAIKKNDELMVVLNIATNSGSESQVTEIIPIKHVQNNIVENKGDNEHIIKINAKPNQLIQILDFIKVIGASYDEL